MPALERSRCASPRSSSDEGFVDGVVTDEDDEAGHAHASTLTLRRPQREPRDHRHRAACRKPGQRALRAGHDRSRGSAAASASPSSPRRKGVMTDREARKQGRRRRAPLRGLVTPCRASASKPIEIPEGRQGRRSPRTSSTVEGPQGQARARRCRPDIEVKRQGRRQRRHRVERADDSRRDRAAARPDARARRPTWSTGVTDGLRRARSRSTASVTAPRSRARSSTSRSASRTRSCSRCPRASRPKVETRHDARSSAGSIDKELLGADGREDPQLPSARAVQGQGHQVRRGDDPAQGGQDRQRK